MTKFSEDCSNCQDVFASKNCSNCQNCVGCVNLKNKNYHIFNQPYSKEEYSTKIKELNTKGEEKERIQYFEGMIIARKHNKEKGGTITVRKVSDGVGVEKIFPLHSPTVDKIVIKKQAKVKQSKLYYLRGEYKKRLKEKTF